MVLTSNTAVKNLDVHSWRYLLAITIAQPAAAPATETPAQNCVFTVKPTKPTWSQFHVTGTRVPTAPWEHPQSPHWEFKRQNLVETRATCDFYLGNAGLGPKPRGKEMHPFFVYMCFIHTHTPPRFQIPWPKCIFFFYALLFKATEVTPN